MDTPPAAAVVRAVPSHGGVAASVAAPSASSPDTVWNLLWSSLWPTSRPTRGSGRGGRGGRARQQSLLLPRALKTVVTTLDDPPPPPDPATTTTTTTSSTTSASASASSASWFSCIQLALWVWHRPSSTVSEDLLITFARHSLSGELGEEEEELNDRLETKFHVFAEMGYIMLAVIFTGKMRGSVSKFSFSLLTPHSNLTRYLLVHHIVEDRLLQLVASLRTLMMRVLLPIRGREAEQVLGKFSALLPQFVSTTEGLFRLGLRPADPARTFFCRDHPRFAAYDPTFLHRAITSHLVTQHHTVVMGSDLELVNAWVDSLSLFLRKSELRLSARAGPGAVFVPDLVLQGLPHQELKDEAVIWCRGPLTVIDLDQERVRQSLPRHQHAALRRDYFDALRFGQGPAPLAASPTPLDKPRPLLPEEGLLRDFGGEWSGWVAEVMEEAWRLPVSTREGFVRQAMRILTRRAALLVKYVDYQLARTSFVDMGLVQSMRAELELEPEQDFLVVLAVAERLSPGIYTTLVGNPAALEDKFIELFESF
ncbi:uncharacterized protein ACA1_175590 [Acanthamoeba castellanii str. Neff]|uniref:Uncharacterized protein n=1 Tax=Acanthamoeba castellanii (strain ATCC 30010 / Neff) TaxID=1257118 RepID=L8HH35_ACACF|nr:uncharacterized protein ACA1_175590 [Acanthamoeba castellanii str. Neff]ELR24884.1 hypothetical protein ACA1_175590 [Acanthamoeba castellanii str. Neff]